MIHRAVVAALGVCLVALVPAQVMAQASWLDSSPPMQWNTPGAAIPMAPPTTNPTPACQMNEVAASSPEQTALANRGGKLQSYWPPVSSDGRVVIGALAEYDGTCRPSEYNVFVFNQGQYAGTLSPVNMLSRTDGALVPIAANQVAIIGPSGTIAADFIRYADTDPLCCPSRGTTRVIYTVQIAGAGPYVVAGQPQRFIQVPSQLPATGTAPSSGPLLAALGGSLLLFGSLLRRAGRNR
jgi:hypothetical protein